MARHRRAIFATIVVGAAALLTGIYLRSAPEAEAPQTAAATTQMSPAPDASAPPEPTARATAAEIRRRTTLHASAALHAYRSTFVERCWTAAPGPEHIDLRFNLAFDPKGTLVGVGISDSRKAYRADVSACIRGLSVKLTVPPPGAPVQVQVPLTLP